MEIAIFIFYLFACCYLISIIPFLKNTPIAFWQLISLFIVKILAGIAYARFYSLPKYNAGSDTWRFYRLSVKETDWLKSDPVAFVKDIFIYGYSKPGNIFSGENSYWNDLKSNVLVKLIAIMNVVTFKSYYANIIIFNFLFLFGLVALLKTFNVTYPGKQNIIVVCVFLLPSTLFWCSGIHKDGLILSATGMLIYYFYKGVKESFTLKGTLIITVCLVLIFSLRNYLALALLPALLCWWFSEQKPSTSLMIFVTIYLAGVVVFFIAPSIAPSINLPAFLANKQNEFLQLSGTSAVTFKPLQPALSSFIAYFPVALDMAFFRPHINEAKNFSYIPAALEILILSITIFLCIFFAKRQPLKPITLFFIFLSLSIMMISGYTITFSGAIVRYRSFVFPLLMTPLVCMIDFKLLQAKLSYCKAKK